MKGLTLSRYWRSPNRTIYVLATIKRSVVIPALTKSINELNSIIDSLVNEAQNTSSKLVKIAKIRKAIHKSILREQYQDRYTILSKGHLIHENNTKEELIHKLDLLLEDIKVAVSISGNGNKTIKLAVIKALSELGMKVNSKDANIQSNFDEFEDFGEEQSAKTVNLKDIDLLISGEVAFGVLEKPDPKYKWVYGKLHLTLKDVKQDRDINSIMLNIKIKRKTLQDARRSAGIKLTHKLIKSLKKKLVDKIASKQ